MDRLSFSWIWLFMMLNECLCSNTETVFIIYYCLYILYANDSNDSLFLDEKKTYFDLIRVICFKPPSILRIINLLTTNSAYLLYTVWMYVWERMCVENIVAVLLLSWGWDCFLWSHMHTSFFNELGFTVENCSATHHEGFKHIYSYCIRYIKLYFPGLEHHWKNILKLQRYIVLCDFFLILL